jgi:hypothetical protein
MARVLAMLLLASAFAIATLLAPPFARASFACSCMRPPPVAQALQQADAVFAGHLYLLERTIVEMPVPDPRTNKPMRTEGIHARFDAFESWKGVTGRDVEIWTGSGGGDCGYDFEFSAPYLVFANSRPDGRLMTSICSHTRKLADATAERAQLGPGTQAPAGPPVWYAAAAARTQAAPELPDDPPFQPWAAVAAAAVLLPVSLGAVWLLRGRSRPTHRG